MRSVSHSWRRLPFIARLLVAASVALVVAGIAMLMTVAREEAEQARDKLERDMREQLLILPTLLADWIVVGDFAVVKESLDKFAAKEDVLVITFRSERGASVTSRGRLVAAVAPAWFVDLFGVLDLTDRVAVEVGGREYGTLEVALTAQPAIDRAWSRLKRHLSVLALAVLLDFIGIWLILRGGLSPLRELQRATMALRGGDLSRRVNAEGSAEIRQVMIAFNEMAASLEGDRNRLRAQEEDRLRAKEELERAEQRYRALFEQSRDGIVVLEPKSLRFLEFNAMAHAQLGYTREEFARLGVLDIEAMESAEETARHAERIRQLGWDRFDTRHRSRDGAIRDVQVVVQVVALNGEVTMVAIFRDITDHKTAEAALRLHANIFEHSGEAIVITDRDRRIVLVNPAFTELTGYTFAEVRGQDPKILAAGRTTPETYRAMWTALDGKIGFWQGELWDRRKDGSIYPKWAAISTIRDDAGEVSHYMASFTDVSERKAAEERINFLAHRDPLTGLANRFSLESRLQQVLLAARRDRQWVAVLMIDLDRFKAINDSLGHHVGDTVLMEVARRLLVIVRASDIVARLGGDEFVVVLTGLEAAVDAAPVAHKLQQSLAQPLSLDGRLLYATPSIGISLFPADGDDGDTLMKNADIAMYHAKEHGRNNTQFFTAEMNAAAMERLALEQALRVGLAEGQLLLHYQPQVRASDGKVFGVEALVRWNHPERGLVSPVTFIPVAEECGLIEALGSWVLDEACRQSAAWKAAGLGGVRMAVNLSAHQLRSTNLIEFSRATLARHGLQGDDLELEITESVAMADPQQAIGQLQALHDLGIHLSIDDFGTGYSSLAYLKLLPIQAIKLDRAFVRDIDIDPNDAAISAATVALAKNLGLKVVAEGVETEGQQAFLTALDCDFLQGYLIGRPQPAAVWSELWLAEPDRLVGAEAP